MRYYSSTEIVISYTVIQCLIFFELDSISDSFSRDQLKQKIMGFYAVIGK